MLNINFFIYSPLVDDCFCANGSASGGLTMLSTKASPENPSSTCAESYSCFSFGAGCAVSTESDDLAASLAASPSSGATDCFCACLRL